MKKRSDKKAKGNEILKRKDVKAEELEEKEDIELRKAQSKIVK